MIDLSPPRRPPGTDLMERPNDRTRRNLRLISWGSITVFLTAWFCTMGPIPAILSIVVAKHVLVAILVMGLDVDR